MIPAWRIPPPNCLRNRRARAMNSLLPASADPTGAPSPLEKQTLTVSKWRAYSRSGVPVVTANVTSPGAPAAAWFGQDERRSGTLLARGLRGIPGGPRGEEQREDRRAGLIACMTEDHGAERECRQQDGDATEALHG